MNNDGNNPVSQTVLDRMFKPVDKGKDYTKGGLGMDEAGYFNSIYGVDKPYNPPRYINYSHFVKYTLCGWVGGKRPS